MILKVCSYVDGGGNWVFIGDVAEVLTGRAFLRESRTGKENLHNIGLFAESAAPQVSEGEGEGDGLLVMDKVFLPRQLDGQILGEKKPFVKVKVVYLSLRYGTHLSVVFWEAYLLNDEGKTIERL